MAVLWLLRHGKAADAFGFPGGDAARPLVPKGEAQAAASGRELARHAPRLAAVLTSPRMRARRTAELAAAAHGGAPEPVVIGELGGDLGLRALLALASPWTEEPGEPHVLVVGHNPTLSILAGELSGGHEGLSTGSLIGIDLATRAVVARYRPEV